MTVMPSPARGGRWRAAPEGGRFRFGVNPATAGAAL